EQRIPAIAPPFGGGAVAPEHRRAGAVAHRQQRDGEALVVLAVSPDQLALVVVRHLDAVERALERGVGEVVVAVAERGFPGDVERLTLQSRAQLVGRAAVHADRPRGGADRVGRGELAEEFGHLGLGPAVALAHAHGRPRWWGQRGDLSADSLGRRIGRRRGQLGQAAGRFERLDGLPVVNQPGVHVRRRVARIIGEVVLWRRFGRGGVGRGVGRGRGGASTRPAFGGLVRLPRRGRIGLGAGRRRFGVGIGRRRPRREPHDATGRRGTAAERGVNADRVVTEPREERVVHPAGWNITGTL